jgi:putative ABC transport system substrate-binding protein
MGHLSALDRRSFLHQLAGPGTAAVGLVLLNGCGLVPSTASPARIPRLGYVGEPPSSPWVAGLWDGLRELGWIEGQTLQVERRSDGGLGQSELVPLVAELVALPVDVLVTVGTTDTLAAKQATGTIPIVFTNLGDPVGVGAVASLARPGGNVTGVSTGASGQFWAKRVELLKDIVPGLVRVGYLRNTPDDTPRSALTDAEVQKAAQALGVQVQILGSAVDLGRAFAAATAWPAHGLVVGSGGITLAERVRIAELATRSQLPAIYGFTEFVEAGGLMSYGASNISTYRHAAPFVDRILRGARPADLPVEQLTSIEFAVNVKALQGLGLTIPPDLAAQVTLWLQ